MPPAANGPAANGDDDATPSRKVGNEMPPKNGWAGWVLILVGVILLTDTLDLVPLGSLMRYWPVLLIAIGLRLVIRGRGAAAPPPPPPGG